MSKFSSSFKKYGIFAKAGVQTTLAYRGYIFLWVIGAVVICVVNALLWYAIYRYSPEPVIGGFTYEQMLIYLIMNLVVGDVLYTETMSMISDDIIDGVIGMRLMKPINYRAQLGFTAIGAFVARIVIIGIPTMIIGLLVTIFGFGLACPQWWQILLYFVAAFLSLLILDALHFIFGQLAFKTQAIFGISMIMGTIINFLSGTVIPLSIYPEWAQAILEWTPFPALASTPVLIFMGQLGGMELFKQFMISIVWAVILNVLAFLSFRRSVRHVVVFGG